MLNEVLEMAFAILGVIVVLLACLKMRRLSDRDTTAAAAAAFGLLLCARYSVLVHGAADWLFTFGVGGMMLFLAYNSLTPRAEMAVEDR